MKTRRGCGSDPAAPVLITGGAGFIGSNLAKRLLTDGHRVILFDNLSRPNVGKNVEWLRGAHGDRVELVAADVREPMALSWAVRRSSAVFHLAAQVAVTTSLQDPSADFAINAGGTLNVLETVRALDDRPPVFFTSTNKVYGALEDVPLKRTGNRYEPRAAELASHGVSEQRPLDFHSPYGCSKGTADQYVLDYARCFDLSTVVFRMSCIYGPRQFGTEDQGWVAHFFLRALAGEPITLYGDGLQVRDILFVEDLVEAFLAARRGMSRLSGQAFNVGGGPGNTVSLVELLDLMTEVLGKRPRTTSEGWRIGDQKYYVSDFTKLSRATGWSPRVPVREGVRRLAHWLQTLRDGARPGAAQVETAP
jgi:CDP-paratose 2-epimerase